MFVDGMAKAGHQFFFDIQFGAPQALQAVVKIQTNVRHRIVERFFKLALGLDGRITVIKKVIFIAHHKQRIGL